jgi:predicted AAA+ superfamily ATPase
VQRFEVFYWRERNDEVDFVLRKRGSVVAIEVKSNAEKNTAGLEKFRQVFSPKHAFIVGDAGIHPEEFLGMDLNTLF